MNSVYYTCRCCGKRCLAHWHKGSQISNCCHVNIYDAKPRDLTQEDLIKLEENVKGLKIDVHNIAKQTGSLGYAKEGCGAATRAGLTMDLHDHFAAPPGLKYGPWGGIVREIGEIIICKDRGSNPNAYETAQEIVNRFCVKRK
jgi:hypothetical protein